MYSEHLYQSDQEIINRYTLISGGTAVIPNSYISMAAMGFLQYRMINKLADNHHLPDKNRHAAVIMASAVASGVTILVDQVLTQATDAVPGGNLIAQSITGVALTSLVTTYMGMTFASLFSKGVDFSQLNVADFWAELRTQARENQIENNIIDDLVGSVA